MVQWTRLRYEGNQLGEVVRILRLLSAMSLVLTFSCSLSWGENQARKVPPIVDVLDRILPVKLTEHPSFRDWTQKVTARYVDPYWRDVFWFSLEAVLQTDRTVQWTGEYAFQAEPIRDRVIELSRANPELTGKEIAEQLPFRRLSVSSKTCPELGSLMREIDKYGVSLSLSLGIPTDTPEYRFAFQTYSTGVYLTDESGAAVNATLEHWFFQMRNLLRETCVGEPILDEPAGHSEVVP